MFKALRNMLGLTDWKWLYHREFERHMETMENENEKYHLIQKLKAERDAALEGKAACERGHLELQTKLAAAEAKISRMERVIRDESMIIGETARQLLKTCADTESHAETPPVYGDPASNIPDYVADARLHSDQHSAYPYPGGAGNVDLPDERGTDLRDPEA